MKVLIIVLAMICHVNAFSQDAPIKYFNEGSLNGNVYYSKDIGWKCTVPAGWKLSTLAEQLESTDNGGEMIEESMDISIDSKQMRHLISFYKDDFNSLGSSAEPFKEDFPGEYQQTNNMLGGILYKTFQDNGMTLDTARGSETFGGKRFNAFYITLYSSPGRESVILYQAIFSRLVNGFDFSINISYNNDADKQTLLAVIRNSKFEK